MYKINEIFYSLQGEGTYTGTPAVFIRFSGCNLQCDFCDTEHADYNEMSLEELMDEVDRYKEVETIILTGGEPALQVDEALIEALHEENRFIAIETNGTHALPEGIDWVTCSPKGMKPLKLNRMDELKVVYIGQDVETIYNKVCEQYDLMDAYLQPCTQKNGSANIRETIDYILAHPHWSLSLQTHKLVGFK